MGISQRVLLGLGAWVLLSAALLAYARGVNGQEPPYRYHEMLGLGVPLNALALHALADRWRIGARRSFVLFTAAAWCLVFVAAGTRLSARAVNEGALVHDGWHRAWEPSVRDFVLTDDLDTFLTKVPMAEIPYSDAAMLANGWLRHPYIRSILPAAIREPLRVRKSGASGEGFAPGAYPSSMEDDRARGGIGSFGAGGAADVGGFASEPRACSLGGALKFQIGGFPGGPGLALVLRETKTGAERALFGAAGTSWARFNLWCPAGEFTVVARDDSTQPTGWLAFRDPVELGWLSFWAERLLNHSLQVVFFGLALALAGLRALWLDGDSRGAS
jgi:hypothetical protein